MNELARQIIKEHFAKLGRKGGKSISKKKQLAAKKNGPKGGAPKKLRRTLGDQNP